MIPTALSVHYCPSIEWTALAGQISGSSALSPHSAIKRTHSVSYGADPVCLKVRYSLERHQSLACALRVCLARARHWPGIGGHHTRTLEPMGECSGYTSDFQVLNFVLWTRRSAHTHCTHCTFESGNGLGGVSRRSLPASAGYHVVHYQLGRGITSFITGLPATAFLSDTFHQSPFVQKLV